MVPLHAKRVARTSTSRPRAAAALTSAVRVFLDGATLRRSQHRTGSAFMRRCAGQPHAVRAVVPHCASPRLAPAPIPAHLPAHFASAVADRCCLPPRSQTAACVSCAGGMRGDRSSPWWGQHVLHAPDTSRRRLLCGAGGAVGCASYEGVCWGRRC